jgi:hypothetical protein
VFKGFFEAPQDGEYIFQMSCDDLCEFLLSTGTGVEDDPSALNSLMVSNRRLRFRRYEPLFNRESDWLNGIEFSDWIPMTAG